MLPLLAPLLANPLQITTATIYAIAPHANPKLAAALPDALNFWLPRYGMTDKEVVRHFLGQCSEETDGFKVLKEYASGKAYEWRKDLGNTHPGDGVKFAGGGLTMLTGRKWYERESTELGIDLVNHPELLQRADYAVESACQFWKDTGLIALASDPNNFRAITLKINGGTNGINIRWLYYQSAILAITSDLDSVPASIPEPKPVPAPLQPSAAVPAEAIPAPALEPGPKETKMPLQAPAASPEPGAIVILEAPAQQSRWAELKDFITTTFGDLTMNKTIPPTPILDGQKTNLVAVSGLAATAAVAATGGFAALAQYAPVILTIMIPLAIMALRSAIKNTAVKQAADFADQIAELELNSSNPTIATIAKTVDQVVKGAEGVTTTTAPAN